MIELARNRMARLSTAIGRMPIQLKLILSFICIILIPITLVSWYLFNGVYLNTIKDLTKKNQYILEIEKTNVANNMQVMERTAQLAISNSEINEYLQSREELDTADLIDFKMKTFSSFQYYLFNNPNIANIRLYSENPNVREFWPVIFKESRIKNKPWYQTVLRRNGLVWWEISATNKDVIKNSTVASDQVGDFVTLLREIKYPNDKHNGILEVTMELNNFFMKTFSSVQDTSSQMIVVNREGKAFTNPSLSLMQTLPVETIMAEFAKHGKKTDHEFTFTYNGTPYLCIPSDMEPLDSYLFNVVSLKSALSDVSKRRNTIIIATIILIALLSATSYILHSLILKKLNILRDSMKKVRKGDFNFEIDITSMDEIGELAHHFRQMLKRMNELIVEAVNRQAATKEAELKSLKNQIDSHFLYNTLENLKMLAEIEGQFTISDALTSLGRMMRYNLQWTSNHVRLRDELEHIQNYIAIMNIRYDNNLVLNINVPLVHMEQEVLKMSLQPIVENAVKHGMGSRSEGEKLEIAIHAYVSGDSIIIEVCDNGDGIPESKLKKINLMIRLEDADYQQMRKELNDGESSGIGLRNVDQRIVMFYGKSHGIRVESTEGSFTRVTMTLPYLILAGGVPAHVQSAHR
ncbi:sensor histidine kinase [Paenibacillus sp. Y412MC10]|uniref:cache domain-containing sensor histidine kinase n=1 Tax=Geobacillus sp. (strain Y412MC10) TaxID=481743 RepID=UPI0021B2102D|nr:sensor histidine kinase [Paenibacillus sp. Y412MC10]